MKKEKIEAKKSNSGVVDPASVKIAAKAKIDLPSSDRPMSAKIAYLQGKKPELHYRGNGAVIIALAEKYKGDEKAITAAAQDLHKRKLIVTSNLKSLLYRRLTEYGLIKEAASKLKIQPVFVLEQAAVK